MAEIITPQEPVKVAFSLAPAHNIVTSLSLLDMAEQLSGLGDWVRATKSALTTEQLWVNRLVLHDVNAHLDLEPAESFPAWLDTLAAQDSIVLRDQALLWWMVETRRTLGAEIPPPAEILANRDLYLSLAEQVADRHDQPFDAAFWSEMHDLLTDPPRRQQFIVNHLRAMWDQYLAAEWARNLPLLEESIHAFESLDWSDVTAHQALRRVVLRAQIPPEGQSWLAQMDRVVFVPSIHTGPYLIRLGGHDGPEGWFVFGARIPTGGSSPAPALNRSELLMRLNALANDTRLGILELLAQEGELGTPEVVSQLALSQSAAARHLEHLTATGYLTTRSQQGTNLFQLNPDQVDDTFNVLKQLFRGRLL